MLQTYCMINGDNIEKKNLPVKEHLSSYLEYVACYRCGKYTEHEYFDKFGHWCSAISDGSPPPHWFLVRHANECKDY